MQLIWIRYGYYRYQILKLRPCTNKTFHIGIWFKQAFLNVNKNTILFLKKLIRNRIKFLNSLWPLIHQRQARPITFRLSVSRMRFSRSRVDTAPDVTRSDQWRLAVAHQSMRTIPYIHPPCFHFVSTDAIMTVL